MKQGFCPDLEKATIEYHEGHRDKGTKLVKFVCNPRGEPMMLVRCTDEEGNKISILESFYWNALYCRWDISDVYWDFRENEKSLVASYMGSEEEDDGQSAEP